MSIIEHSDKPGNGMSYRSLQSATSKKRKKALPPNPYIMGGSTRNTKIEIDTLVLNLHLSISDYGKELFPRLAQAKERIQASDHASEEHFQFADSKYFQWNLQRIGAKFYPYVLRCGDVTLLLSDRDKDSSIPSARLQIGSLTCQDSAYTMFERLKGWLSLFGLTVEKDSISRVDICHDFRFDIKDKRISIFDDDFIVCKARDSAQYRCNRKITGVQYGKGDIVLRIYDKLLEIRKPHSIHKLDFFLDKWQGQIEKGQKHKQLHSVTRVEFQLRRKSLNQFLKVGNFQDFLNNSLKIWKYLTIEWFRHSSHEIDRDNRNQDKAKISFFWKTVQAIANTPDIAIRALKKNRFKAIQPLLDQTRGLLISICAGLGHAPGDYFGMLGTVQKIAAEQMEVAMEESLPFRKKFLALANDYELTF